MASRRTTFVVGMTALATGILAFTGLTILELTRAGPQSGPRSLAAANSARAQKSKAPLDESRVDDGARAAGASGAGTRAAAQSAADSAGAGTRREIREAIARAPVLDASGVDAYLDQLVSQARRKGRVTALEIEPGMAMIARYTSEPDARAAFSQRMLELQQELAGVAPPQLADPHETSRELSALLDTARASEGEARQTAIRDYLAHAQQLPDEQRLEATAALDEVTTEDRPAGPDPDAATVLWESIQAAPDDATRQSLIREYLMSIQDLPDEERFERSAALDELIASSELGSDEVEIANADWRATGQKPTER